MNIKKACILFLGILIAFNTSISSYAGQLQDFEKAASSNDDKKDDKKKHKKEKKCNNEDDDKSFWGIFFKDMFSEIFISSFRGMFLAVIHGGQLSLYRIQGSTDPAFKKILLRKDGSPDIPFFRTDFNYHNVHSDIDGFDGRIEAGYGPFAIQCRNTYFKEKPADDMNLGYFHGLYRISGSSAFEFDTGVGAILLYGEKHNSGLSFTFPINIYPNSNLNIRVVPVWSVINGNGIEDYDGSLAYVSKYFSLRLGYRRIQAHENVLEGPYAGFSIHY
ncbi:MAG: hypothetical protein HQK78_17055 [Desulfobacterales bacterium]|nr:hypothetical protein [Desulfobacterales bacterium]